MSNPQLHENNYVAVRGFNYQPSYGSTGFELWRRFDADVIRLEIGRGKRYFPGTNAVRFWLSWQAFIREPDTFARHFDTALGIFAEWRLAVMPVLFNRWHDTVLDYGGVYVDHFMPGNWGYREDQFDAYVRRIVGDHRDDPRIFAWDLCNEPGPWDPKGSAHADLVRGEFQWLQRMYNLCKEVGATAPVTVGTLPSLAHLEHWEPLSDILCTHPYALASFSPPDKYEPFLDACVAFAKAKNKPLLATETCWGSLEDAHRVAIIRYTLAQLKQRRIGWLVYLLHHSLIADAHRPEFGPVGAPGNLAFIEADGTLRPGHDAFNEY